MWRLGAAVRATDPLPLSFRAATSKIVLVFFLFFPLVVKPKIYASVNVGCIVYPPFFFSFCVTFYGAFFFSYYEVGNLAKKLIPYLI